MLFLDEVQAKNEAKSMPSEGVFMKDLAAGEEVAAEDQVLGRLW